MIKEITLNKPYRPINNNNGFYFKISKNIGNSSLCFIGDTGTDYPEQKESKSLLKNCEQVRHLGDIIYQVGIQSLKDKELKSKFLNYYSPFKVPWYLIFGNHDYYGKLGPWFELAKKTPNLNLPNYYYAENYNGLCFVTIDSTPIYYDDNLKKPRTIEQIKWLNNLRPELKSSCHFTMLITHYPYYSPTGRDAWKGLKKFYDEYILGKFDVIMAGHEHLLSYDGAVMGTHNFISGSGGKGLRKDQKINKRVFVEQTPGIIRMKRVDKKTYHFKVQTVKGRIFDLKIKGQGLRK